MSRSRARAAVLTAVVSLCAVLLLAPTVPAHMSRPCPGQVATGPYGTDRSSRSAYVDDTQEPSREVDDYEFGATRGFVVELRVVPGAECAFDVAAQMVDMEPDFEVQPAGGDRELAAILLPIAAPVRASLRPEVSVTREQDPPDDGTRPHGEFRDEPGWGIT